MYSELICINKNLINENKNKIIKKAQKVIILTLKTKHNLII